MPRCCVVGAIIGVLIIPLPSHMYCPLEVQARDAETVYATVDGLLKEVYVHPGDVVTKGQKLAQLENIDVQIQIAELIGQRNVLQTQLDGLHYASFDDRHASAQIEPMTKALAGTEQQLVQRKIDLEKLTLVAPRDGTVLPPPNVEKHGDENTRLPTWSGSPFDRDNLGARLANGPKFCQIGDPKSMEARLVIDQNDVEFVQPGQKVEIILDQTADYVYTNCEIERVSTEDKKESPAHLSSLHGGPLPSKMDPASGVARPLNPIFEAVVPLPEQDPHGLLRLGLVGRAKSPRPHELFSAG